MAFLVARKDGRFEIRELLATEAGAQARTLASFRELDDDVLDRAAANARRPFDPDAIRERAAELALQWIGKTDRQRGEAIVDLLELGDALPRREPPPRSSFPRIRSDQ